MGARPTKYAGNVNIGEEIVYLGARAVRIFKRLDRFGYVEAYIGHFADSGITAFRGLLI